MPLGQKKTSASGLGRSDPRRGETWKAKHGDPLLNYPPKYKAYVQDRLKEAPPPFKPSSIDVSDKTAIIQASEYRDNKWYLWSLAPSSRTWKSLGEYRGNPPRGENPEGKTFRVSLLVGSHPPRNEVEILHMGPMATRVDATEAIKRMPKYWRERMEILAIDEVKKGER
jgi:hypothetical protein